MEKDWSKHFEQSYVHSSTKGTNEAYLEKKKMAKKLDKIYIVDIEATCWEKKSPDGQISEIIQVGIARIEELVMTALGYVLPQIL